MMYSLLPFLNSSKVKVLSLILGSLYLLNLCRCTTQTPTPTNSLESVPYQTSPYSLMVPEFFPQPQLSEENPLTFEGIALGRKLYYDPIMDGKGNRSCSSCHIQGQAFQINNGSHQVVPHINMTWTTKFMWDGGFEGTLEEVMIFEVEEFFNTDLSKLNNNWEYRKLFKGAFNVNEITSKEAAFALAQFARTLNSTDSKYDQFNRGELSLSPEEMKGYMLFFNEKGDCFHCHSPELFTDNQTRNNGLDMNPDSGYFAHSKDPQDVGKFKTPTLRNIELTAPYMHDGRFTTLEEVVEFYANGVQNSPNIDPLMLHSSAGGNKLTPEEQANLIAFLKTLTDSNFTTREELSNPF